MFLSPPWGGPGIISIPIHIDVIDEGYHRVGEQFDLHSMTPDGFEIYKKARMITRNIAYFLPRNTDTDQLLQLAAPYSIEIEENYLNQRLKAITAYFGSLKLDPAQIKDNPKKQKRS